MLDGPMKKTEGVVSTCSISIIGPWVPENPEKQSWVVSSVNWGPLEPVYWGNESEGRADIKAQGDSSIQIW